MTETRALHVNLPEPDRYPRFFSMPHTVIEHYVRRLGARLDGEIVGVASYHALTEPEHADLAVVVAHPAQAHGVGTLLLEHLGSLARRRGVRYLHADLLAVNTRMLRLLTDSRDVVANRASPRSVLEPASVAMIGADCSPGSVGHAVLRKLLDGEFRGTVWRGCRRTAAGLRADRADRGHEGFGSCWRGGRDDAVGGVRFTRGRE